MRLMASILAFALLATPAAADLADQALSLINQQRAAKGCAALSRNAGLQTAAEAHARDMSRNNFFGHKGSNGSSHAQRFRKAGYDTRDTAENIAAGSKTAAEVVATWAKSPAHRKNMLNCGFKSAGLAVVHDPADRPLKGNTAAFKYYWVATFGAD